jgi:hypothetical protein
MSVGVHERGIPQAPVVAMRDKWDETWVAIEKLGDWAQLQSTLIASPDRRLCTIYGRFARRLHDAGIAQYDFNPTNILVRGRELMLIDFELMKLHEREVPRAERMKSIGKMNRVPSISRTNRLRFLLGYLDADAVERKNWKAAARELLAIHAEKVDHDLDRAERRCLDENRDYGAFEAGDWRGHYVKKRDDRTWGLTLDEAKALALSEAYRFEAAADAIAAWQQANRKAKEGGPAPVAVLVKRSSADGKIAFPKS